MESEQQRITMSRETLRAELSALELRLVDRLNGALQEKASRSDVAAVRDLALSNQNRLITLEANAIVKNGPVVQHVDDLEKEMMTLREMGKYKKWLWAQTVALAAIAVPVVVFAVEHIEHLHS